MDYLVDNKFGKLTVLSKAKSIIGGISKKRYWGAWNCKCDCGNLIIVKTVFLKNKSVTSCGCSKLESKSPLYVGCKKNRLTMVRYLVGKWECLCDCGSLVTIETPRINSGNTKSCGCLKTEVSSNKSNKLIEGRRKFTPHIASARRVWKNYCYRDKYCIDFNTFLKISGRNCHYCNCNPNTKFNYFNAPSSRGSGKAKKEGLFIYNGLDRIDSSKNHTEDNIVPCCYQCNAAKNNMTIIDFINYIKKLNVKNTTYYNVKKIKLPENGSLTSSIKCVFSLYKNEDLAIEEFYYLSQLPCFYCNNIGVNSFSKAKTDKKSSDEAKLNGLFIYNGLDRVDSNLGHTKNNIVPCCKYCNFAKNKQTLSEFQEWIKRVTDFQNLK